MDCDFFYEMNTFVLFLSSNHLLLNFNFTEKILTAQEDLARPKTAHVRFQAEVR